MITTSDDVAYEENEIIKWIHDFVLGIKPDEIDKL